MPSPPSCSVVIPTYNRAAWVTRAIDSVLAQSLPPARIVVVDDGSTDATSAVLDAYRDRCDVLRIDNAGPQVARNFGVRRCDSVWIAFLDDDDVWRPDHLRGLMALAGAAPTLSLVFADFALYRGDKIEPLSKFETAPAGWWDGVIAERRAEGWLLGPNLAEACFRFHPLFPTAAAISREFFWSLGGFDPKMRKRRGEDGPFFAHAMLVGATGAVPSVSAEVNKHGASATSDLDSRGKLDNLLSEIYSLREFRETHPDHPNLFETIDAEVLRRSLMAAHAAFAALDHATLRQLAATLPAAALDPALRVKRLIAALPDALGMPLNRLLQRVNASTRAPRD
jgi:glycosyltransferase involved in cell wall biosynthesis